MLYYWFMLTFTYWVFSILHAVVYIENSRPQLTDPAFIVAYLSIVPLTRQFISSQKVSNTIIVSIVVVDRLRMEQFIGAV